MRYIALIATVLAAATVQAQCEPDFDFGEAEWGRLQTLPLENNLTPPT